MVNLGSAYDVYKAEQANPFASCAESWSVGLWSGYHIMTAPQNTQIINVSFKPGGAYPFLQLPLAELNNQIVALDAIWGNLAGEIRQRLYAAPTIQARFALQALSDSIGISQKHLIAQFKRMVGGTPKELARLYRFQRVLHRLDPTRPVDLSLVPRQSSYYDQSHLSKEFEAFTGHNPTDYLRLRDQVYVEHPEQDHYTNQLPTG
jgi:AraC-like DNA-binding protein